MIERWAVFFSGRGSNLNSVLHQSDQKLVLGVTNKKNCLGRFRLKRAGVPCVVMTSPINWESINSILHQKRITHIFLLGFMKLLPGAFLDLWKNRILNVHPSLLPSFPGLKAFERSYSDRSNVGVTVHQVIEEMDAGKILLQKKVLGRSDENWPTLEQAQLLLSSAEQRLVQKSLSHPRSFIKWN